MAVLVAWSQARAADSDWSLTGDLSIKHAFDSNVFLQDVEPDPSIAGAAQPSRESFVTTITPKAGFRYDPLAGFNVSGSYAPEFAFFHSEPGEDFAAHRLALLFNGQVRQVTWQMQNNLTWIDGSDTGLIFGGPGGSPAIGGIPIRDRREAVIYRNTFTAFHNYGNWFFRPAAASYVHDFRTELRDPARHPSYQNYLDRNDFNLGLDIGYKAFGDGFVFVAWRIGWQHETELPPGKPFDYSNDYQRFLLGYEGQLTDWMKLKIFAGPDWRNFNHRTPPSFDPDRVEFFLDASAEVTLSKADTLLLTARQFEQPSSGTPSAYEDITYDVAWARKWGEKLSSKTGFKAYGGDWQAPVQREDWIFTPSVSVTYLASKQLGLDLAWSYDWSESRVPGKTGREFTRHIVSITARYSF